MLGEVRPQPADGIIVGGPGKDGVVIDAHDASLGDEVLQERGRQLMATHEIGQRRGVEGLPLQIGEHGAGRRFLLRREALPGTRRGYFSVALDYDAVAGERAERRGKEYGRNAR